jgi:hypothetical protein
MSPDNPDPIRRTTRRSGTPTVAERLKAAPPAVRLVLRADPAVVAYALALQARAAWLMLEFITFGSAQPAAVHKGTAHLVRARDLTRSLARALLLTRDLTHDISRDLDSAQDCAHGLPRPDNLINDLDRCLARARALARDLGREDRHDLGISQEIDNAVTVDRALDRALEYARSSATNRDDAREFALVLAGASASASVDAEALHIARSDFTNVDLRDSYPRMADLAGIRWSQSTRWPTGWQERVERVSVPVGDGIFEIHASGTTA